MHFFSIEAEIDAPPDRVWEIMRDVEKWPEWTSTVTSVRPLGKGTLSVGSRYVIRQPKLPPARWVCTELDEAGRSFTWVNRGVGILVEAKHWVEPRNGGSRAHLSIRFSGFLAPLVARLTRDLNNRYLAVEPMDSTAGVRPRRRLSDDRKPRAVFLCERTGVDLNRQPFLFAQIVTGLVHLGDNDRLEIAGEPNWFEQVSFEQKLYFLACRGIRQPAIQHATFVNILLQMMNRLRIDSAQEFEADLVLGRDVHLQGRI